MRKTLVWTYEKCADESKKYGTRGEFQKGSKYAYQKSWDMEWLDDFIWLVPSGYKKMTKWTKDKCLEEARKYTSRKQFQTANASAYMSALHNGWLDSYTWFERPAPHNKIWDEETCRKEALKYKSRGELAKGCGGAYREARKNGWLNDYVWFQQPKSWKREN